MEVYRTTNFQSKGSPILQVGHSGPSPQITCFVEQTKLSWIQFLSSCFYSIFSYFSFKKLRTRNTGSLKLAYIINARTPEYRQTKQRLSTAASFSQWFSILFLLVHVCLQRQPVHRPLRYVRFSMGTPKYNKMKE